MEYFSFLSPALISDPVIDVIFLDEVPAVELLAGPEHTMSFLGLNFGIS